MTVENGEGGVKEDLEGIEGLNIKLDDKGEIIEGDLGDDKTVETDESAEILRKSIEEAHTPPASKKEEKDDKPTKFELGEETFFEGDEEKLDELVRDPKAFNAFMNNVYKKAVEKGHTLAVENIMRSAPEIVKSQVVQQIAINTAVKEFYEDNKDLAPYKQTVAAIASKVASENPQLPLKQLFKVTEQVARKRLSLMKKVDDKEKGGKPKFPSKPTGNRGGKKEDLDGVAKEFDDMLSIL